jgi:hypothetical protein
MFDLWARMLISQVHPRGIPARVFHQLLQILGRRALRTAQVGSSAITEEIELAVTEPRSKNRRPKRALMISVL